jgi:hypothetical protein
MLAAILRLPRLALLRQLLHTVVHKARQERNIRHRLSLICMPPLSGIYMLFQPDIHKPAVSHILFPTDCCWNVGRAYTSYMRLCISMSTVHKLSSSLYIDACTW